MKKILVIEDDSPLRAGIATALRRNGFAVLDTGLGAEGLALALTQSPDLILSDVNLPGMNGLDVLKGLRNRAETSGIPVVVMTGEPHKVDARTSMDRGADDYLAKPFTMQQLLTTIAGRLERQDKIKRALASQNQADLIGAEEKLRLQTTALEAAANGIAITDRSGKILWINQAFSKLTGYAYAEAVGQNPRVLKSDQHSQKFYADMWATILTGNVWQGELVNKRKDGSSYFEEMTITPVRGENGEVQNFIAIKQDVSKRKEIERALAQKRDLLQALMDNLPDHIYFKDTESRFTRINQAQARHLGLQNPETATGRSDADFFPMHLARQKLVDERRLFATGQPVLGLVEKSGTADEIKWVSSTKVPIRGPDGKITGLVGISRDITEGKRAEEALQESRRFLQSTLDALSTHIAILDEQGTIIKVNAAWNRFATENNFQGAHGVGDNYLQICQRASGNSCEEAAAAAAGISEVMLGQRREFRLEYPCHSPAEERWFILKATRFEGDGPIRVVVAHENISERKLAEKQLLVSEQRYRNLFAHMTEGFAYCRMIFEAGRPVDFVYLEVNRMFSTLTGLKDVVGKRVTEVIPGIRESDPDLLEIYGRVATNGKSERCERFVRALQMWFEISVYSTEPDHFVVVFDVITERKRAEEALRDSEEKFRGLVENFRDAILTMDPATGKFNSGNPAALKMFGAKSEEEFMRFSPAMLSPERQPDGGASAEKATQITEMVVREGSQRFEWTHRRISGEEFSAEVLLTRMERGGKPMILSTIRDITERKRLETQLFQARKLESIGQLAAGIAHEINTPTQYVGDNTRFVKDSFAAIVKVLKGHEELLAAARQNAVTPELLAHSEAVLAAGDLDYLRGQIPQALTETLEGVERVSKIVRAMKEFSHPGGREKTPADLNKAIESTVTVARNEWKYVADLKLELEPNLPFVPCFLGEFNQAILNLIVNAAHAIGDVVNKNPGTKGTITVQTRRDGDHVEVRVADTGTGIPEAARSKIFEPFFTTKEVGKGTGQGLAMIYGSVVNRHGGTAAFETETGKGTTFIIRLPLKPTGAPATASPPPSKVPAA